MKFSAQIALVIALSSASTVVATPLSVDQNAGMVRYFDKRCFCYSWKAVEEDSTSAATIKAAVEEAEAHAVAINETAALEPKVKASQ
ncbi:hypothetical protein CI238_05421 [Colletotrichum incanum]|uniref:Uncharacterized protein n=1 Tax=Colletotrichum incanum TaxID=1573173 RepID=A0A161W836_COLIC|nr:hypothetical protein CI238_05421 [Colletotrichum incanum]